MDGAADRRRAMVRRSATYFYHSAHQRFIRENKTIWDEVYVENAIIDE